MSRILKIHPVAVSFVTFAAALAATSACSDSERPTASDLVQRAYIISRESDELTVIDLERLEIIGRVATKGLVNHMAELNADFTKLYVDSSESDEAVVVDTEALRVVNRIAVGRHPTHLSLSRDGGVLAIMNEDDNSISFIDPSTDREIKRLPGFFTPHFMRFSADGQFGYVANINAHHLTRVDLTSLQIESHIALEGFAGPPSATEAPGESGFADAQIDRNGILYAAHRGSGRVLVYDTVTRSKRPEIKVGANPWIVFAEHPFAEVLPRQLVPNFDSKTVSMIAMGSDANQSTVTSLPGDQESYGVNFSSLAPSKAFVMNRIRQDIAVVDMTSGDIVDRIAVGGNTETASTTADGKWIVATVSRANRVVVIDAVTNQIVKTFENVGRYPWSVTIPLGQNYCH
jgi:YVTN family beta-propeller protein